MYSYKNFEVRYCLNRGENVGFEVLHKEDGSKEHRCLREKECGENCELMSGLPMGNPSASNAFISGNGVFCKKESRAILPCFLYVTGTVLLPLPESPCVPGWPGRLK